MFYIHKTVTVLFAKNTNVVYQWRRETMAFLFIKNISLFLYCHKRVEWAARERERQTKRQTTAIIDTMLGTYLRGSQELLGFTSYLLNPHWDTYFRTSCFLDRWFSAGGHLIPLLPADLFYLLVALQTDRFSAESLVII